MKRGLVMSSIGLVFAFGMSPLAAQSFDGYKLTGHLNLAQAGDRDESQFLTSDFTILCRQAYDLAEARKAAGDSSWMREIGCIVAKPGLKVIKIEPDNLFDRGPWRVRVEFPDGPGGLTMWGERYQFRFTNGSRVGYGG